MKKEQKYHSVDFVVEVEWLVFVEIHVVILCLCLFLCHNVCYLLDNIELIHFEHRILILFKYFIFRRTFVRRKLYSIFRKDLVSRKLNSVHVNNKAQSESRLCNKITKKPQERLFHSENGSC